MRLVAAAFAVLLTACSSSVDSGPTEQTQAGVGAQLPDPRPPTGPLPATSDAGSPTACAEIGAACVTTNDCLCGEGAGCAWDNVACSSGHTCVTVSSVGSTSDPSWQCCGGCESTYQACKGPGCLAAWTACNATCGLPAGCPVNCLAH